MNAQNCNMANDNIALTLSEISKNKETQHQQALARATSNGLIQIGINHPDAVLFVYLFISFQIFKIIIAVYLFIKTTLLCAVHSNSKLCNIQCAHHHMLLPIFHLSALDHVVATAECSQFSCHQVSKFD